MRFSAAAGSDRCEESLSFLQGPRAPWTFFAEARTKHHAEAAADTFLQMTQ